MKLASFKSAWSLLLLSLALFSGAIDAEEIPVWRYTVKPGDNLSTIAERYLIRAEHWPKVQKANRIADPHRIVPGTVLRIPGNMLRTTPGQALLDGVSGRVRWRVGAGDWQLATNGLRLASGASLETMDDASALLILADGSKILVAPNSQLTLDALSLYAGGLMADTRMRLQSGQADIIANPQQRSHQHLRIQTPSAQAVVRGTHFRVSASADATREETLGGLVGVSASGQRVDVPMGRGTVARAGEAPMKPVPLLAAADVSAFPARFEYLPLRFPLPQLSAVKEWQGQIAPDKAFERILLSKTGNGQALSFADLPNGDYVLRLRAMDANGLQGFDAVHAFTVFARPFPPRLNAPGDGATLRSARAEFGWGSVADVARYHLQVSAGPDFTALVYDEMLDRDAWPAPQELPAGQLYWRAASVTETGLQGPWSRAAAFTYTPGPGAVELGRTALRIESDKLVLTLPPPPAGLLYEAILSSAKDMEPVLAQARSEDGSLALPRPDAGSYFLGVRLVDPADNTPGPVSVQKIEIPPSRLWLLLLLLPLAL